MIGGPMPGGVGGRRLNQHGAVLRWVPGGGGAASWEVPLDQPRIRLGRDDPPRLSVDLDVTRADPSRAGTVSRLHAELQWVEGHLEVRDLGSRNGTWVNGERLTRDGQGPLSVTRRLQAGDRLQFGDYRFEVLQGR